MSSRRHGADVRLRGALLAFVLSLFAFGCAPTEDDGWQEVAPGRLSEIGQPRTDTVDADDPPPPLFCAVVVYGIGLGGTGSLFVWALIRALKHGRKARRLRGPDPSTPLVPGPVLAFGTVELDGEGDSPAASTVLHQVAVDRGPKRRGVRHWAGASQETTARPFFLRLSSGDRVRVVPDTETLFDGRLRLPGARARAHRMLVADLNAGDEVWVSGVFVASEVPDVPYRSMGGGGPEIRPPETSPMELTTERPGALAARRAGFYRRRAIAFAVVLGALHLGVLLPYYLLSWGGSRVEGEPAATHTWVEWTKPKNSVGYWKRFFEVRVRDPESLWLFFEGECDRATWERARRGLGTVPFLVWRPWPALHRAGSSASLEAWQVILVFMTTVASGVGWHLTRKEEPW